MTKLISIKQNANLKTKYKGTDYIDMLHRGTNIYCELCPSRWDCAC